MSTESQNNVTEGATFEDLVKGFSFTPPTEEDTIPKELTFEPLNLKIEGVDDKKEEEVVAEPKEDFKALDLTPKKENIYANLVKKKLEKGLWEDAIIKEGDTEVKLSEMEDITEEEYLKLEEDQKALKEDDSKEKYISVDGISEERKLILEIVKNGGDLKELFQSEQQLEKPFDETKGWDLENESHQESIVYQHYLSQGNTPSRAKLLLEEDKKELVLDSVAKQIVDYHQKAFSDNLKVVNERLIEENKTEKENIKNFRAELTKGYKDNKIPDHQIKKLVDLATKETADGFEIDNLYETIMKDPKRAQELIFFMADQEKYLEQKMLETKVKTNISNMRTVNRIAKEPAQKQTTEENKNDSGFRFAINP